MGLFVDLGLSRGLKLPVAITIYRVGQAVPMFEHQGGIVRQIVHVCENCFREYLPERECQRWCAPECREEYRNAELRAARRLWREAGKPREVFEECRES